MRATIQEIYFGKTKDILNDLRSMTDLKTVKGQNAMVREIFDFSKRNCWADCRNATKSK
jgi:hypothetical protein